MASKTEVFNKIMQDVYTGFEGSIHPELFELYKNNFTKAVASGFGSEKSKFYKMLNLNVSHFAAYKAFHLTKQLKSITTKDKAAYIEVATRLVKKFNNWQATESNTVVSRSRTAKQFQEFNDDKGSMLEWIHTRSVNPREPHLQFVGTVLPVNHPFWRINQPGNLWGCKCDWVQTNKKETKAPAKEVLPAKGLEGNPGITREIFSENHPYYAKAKDNKEIEKFIHDNVDYEVKAKYSNGGVYYKHVLVEETASDYKEVKLCADLFAKEGKEVYHLPEIHRDNNLYKKLFKEAYKNVCPDLKINGKFYEVEGSKKGNSPEKMISRGLLQSSRIIIDGNKLKSTGWIFRSINDHLKNGTEIDEIWLFMKDKLIKIY